MTFDLTEGVTLEKDDSGNVQSLEHLGQPFVAGQISDSSSFMDSAIPNTPQALADQYLRVVASHYGIDQSMLGHASFDAFTDGKTAGSPDGILEVADEKEILGTTIVSYQQNYKGLPVWKAGASVTIQSEPLRVTASQSSVHQNIWLDPDSLQSSETIGPDKLKRILTLTKVDPEVTGARRLIYQFDKDRRIDPEVKSASEEGFESGPPTLPLPQMPPEIIDGQHYVVTEVLFTMPVKGIGPVNWRVFIDEKTNAVLYLRALIACASGKIFRTDPLTAGASVGVTPIASAAALNPFRATVSFQGLTNGNPQALNGQFVRLVDSQTPPFPAPTATNPPANFFFDAPSREFAAANAYYHCDGLFRLMEEMGFNLASYFDGTSFPVPVDASAFSDEINARAPGNTTGTGSGGFLFGLAGSPFPAVSIAADVRVALHEFGHTLLWDSVHSPNFGFAHSAGDSLAAILMDPESALRTDPIKRFHTFPWILPNRQHGRDVATGWAWGGTNDVGGYSSEQILSTTHFRLYRSLGGDSDDLNTRKMAARQTVYLIFRAIGSLASNPVTPTPNPSVYATALMNADIGTINFDGYRGGALHKVIRWSFEKQGLFQPPGAPVPVRQPGAPPDIDVYINDGVDYLGNPRNGEYVFQPVHWECKDIWNRLSAVPSGGGGVHETPVIGRTNFAYVRVKNRGTKTATNVVVRGYSADPGAGLTWPGDWRPMGTAQISAGNIPPGGVQIVGPFKWKPQNVGHECMFMEVSAPGDRSNIDPATFFPSANGPTPEWRVVPFDNNIGQRNVAPVAGGGGLRGLLSSFIGRKFKVRNPTNKPARMEITSELPKLLSERGWGVRLDHRDSKFIFELGPGASREVLIELKPGQEFNTQEIQVPEANIRLAVFGDGQLIGGMTYQLDATLTKAPVERVGVQPISLNDEAIEEAISDAQEDDDMNGGDASGAIVPVEVLSTPAPDMDAIGQLLSQLGINDGIVKNVNRVRLRKVLVEVDLEE